MTKNPEKVANIKAAISVFEDWQAKNGSDPSATKNSKPTNDDAKADTVPGLGFKDAEAAKKTLECVSSLIYQIPFYSSEHSSS